MRTLLAVDLGVRTGLAVYGDDGRLRSYRSQNFGSSARLRRAAPAVLDGTAGAAAVIVEGGGPLLAVWEREASRRGLELLHVFAEDWRRTFLLPREHRRGAEAKARADALARRVIAWSEAPRPTSLRHDAAEAILIGLYGALLLGWLRTVPAELRR